MGEINIEKLIEEREAMEKEKEEIRTYSDFRKNVSRNQRYFRFD